MGCDMVVSRYVTPTGIPCVDGLSTGPLGFGTFQDETTSKDNSIMN